MVTCPLHACQHHRDRTGSHVLPVVLLIPVPPPQATAQQSTATKELSSSCARTPAPAPAPVPDVLQPAQLLAAPAIPPGFAAVPSWPAVTIRVLMHPNLPLAIPALATEVDARCYPWVAA